MDCVHGEATAVVLNVVNGGHLVEDGLVLSVQETTKIPGPVETR